MKSKVNISVLILRIAIMLGSVLIMIALDAFTKQLALKYLTQSEYVPLIGDVLGFILVGNQGMGWGLLSGKQLLFIVLTPVAIAIVTCLYFKMPFEEKFIPIRIAELMMIGGAFGNLFDRVFRGELFHGTVVDMIYVKIINFPVFNVADCFITISFAMLLVLLIFVYKDEDLEKIFNVKFLKKDKKVSENEDN